MGTGCPGGASSLQTPRVRLGGSEHSWSRGCPRSVQDQTALGGSFQPEPFCDSMTAEPGSM